MSRFIEGQDRHQVTLLPECLESIQRYMSALETADRTLPLLEFGPRYAHLTDKIKTLREQMRRMDRMKERPKEEPDEPLSLTDRKRGLKAALPDWPLMSRI